MRTGEDEWEFENSFPERTRSSISAYYPFIVFWSEGVMNEYAHHGVFAKTRADNREYPATSRVTFD